MTEPAAGLVVKALMLVVIVAEPRGMAGVLVVLT
jgi:hypothetical protein